VSHYARQFGLVAGSVPVHLLDFFDGYDWPGNIRELENTAKRYVVFSDAEALIAELNESRSIRKALAAPPATMGENDLKLRVRDMKQETEGRAIRQMLQETNWNRKEAARRLNISYKALLYKLRQYGLERSNRGDGEKEPFNSTLRRAAGSGLL
jgi:two-component system, NtrC family, response regulator AtoC